MEVMKLLQKQLLSGRSLILVALLGCIFASSCRKDEDGDTLFNLKDFMSKQEPGLCGYGGFLFKYTPKECQISVNTGRKQIRMQNDNQTNWLHMQFSRFPSENMEDIEMEFRYMSGGDEIVHSTIMKSVKAESDKIWLWDEEQNLGIVLPICW